MTATYDLIASNVLSSSASSVTFSSIPATYRDLVLVSEITPSSASYFFVRYNGDSGSNYSTVTMSGDGGATFSGSTTTTQAYLNYYLTASTTNANLSTLQIMDYSATDKHKTGIVRSGAANRVIEGIANRWANTSAINQIVISASTGNFNSGSTFYLYGIVS